MADRWLSLAGDWSRACGAFRRASASADARTARRRGRFWRWIRRWS